PPAQNARSFADTITAAYAWGSLLQAANAPAISARMAEVSALSARGLFSATTPAAPSRRATRWASGAPAGGAGAIGVVVSVSGPVTPFLPQVIPARPREGARFLRLPQFC